MSGRAEVITNTGAIIQKTRFSEQNRNQARRQTNQEVLSSEKKEISGTSVKKDKERQKNRTLANS